MTIQRCVNGQIGTILTNEIPCDGDSTILTRLNDFNIRYGAKIRQELTNILASRFRDKSEVKRYKNIDKLKKAWTTSEEGKVASMIPGMSEDALSMLIDQFGSLTPPAERRNHSHRNYKGDIEETRGWLFFKKRPASVKQTSAEVTSPLTVDLDGDTWSTPDSLQSKWTGSSVGDANSQDTLLTSASSPHVSPRQEDKDGTLSPVEEHSNEE